MFKNLRKIFNVEKTQEPDSLQKSARSPIELIELGNTLEEQGEFNQALALYQESVQLQPNFARGYLNIGNIHLANRHFPNALRAYQQAAAVQHDFAPAFYNIANVHMELKEYPQALFNFKKATILKPDFAHAFVGEGNALSEMKRYQEAAISYQKALELDPSNPEISANLADCYNDIGDLDGCIKFLKKAMESQGDTTRQANLLVNVYRELGRIEEAISICRTTLAANPDLDTCFTTYLFCLCHSNEISTEEFIAEHIRFGTYFSSKLTAQPAPHTNVKDPNRAIKVGIVSADLRQHAVAFFIDPILRILSKSTEINLTIYYNETIIDDVTRDFKSFLPNWRDISGYGDDELAGLIRQDHIDVLVDLSGHTGKHRLLTFIRKPAPLQLSWMGYPGTTGLQQMDYYIADKHFLPPGLLDEQFVEKIARVPVMSGFRPFFDSADVNELPAIKNKYFTFASFNRSDKISEQVVALWAKVLRAVPTAKMVIAGLPAHGNTGDLRTWFKNNGIDESRLTFHARQDMYAYLKLHHEVDLCLDTFPYTGATTTLHALWMGVPTLTMVGRHAAGRPSAANLGHLGLGDRFCCHNEHEFINMAQSFSTDWDQLATLRGELRTKFLGCDFLNSDLVAQSFACAVKAMWQNYCRDEPVRSFNIERVNGEFVVEFAS